MSKQLFIRDKAAVDCALFKSLAEFKVTYEAFDSTHDLKQIYDNIRKDSVQKDKTLRDKLYHDPKMGAEETKTEVKKASTSTNETLITKSTNDEQFLVTEIKKIFEVDYKKKQGTPTETFKILSERFVGTTFDKKQVQKIHYKYRDGKLDYKK